MDKFFAGIDVSTQSLKFIIINLTGQAIVYRDSINYDKDLPEFQTLNGIIINQSKGVAESNPLMWINALNIIFDRAKRKTKFLPKIRSISVSGQQHGLVSLTEDGKLAKPTSKLWNDFSTQTECELLDVGIGGTDKMIETIGNSQKTGYSASKIFHMFRNEIDYFNATNSFLLVHNYINWYLTGGVKVMEDGDASGTGLWDPISKTWSKKLVKIISEDLFDKLPAVESSMKSIGKISNELADKYGFDLKCTIDAGSGDNMYGAIGTGNIEPGIVTISLGTSGTIYTMLEKAFVDPTGEIACFCNSIGSYMPLICVSNMAGVYNNFLKANNLSHASFEELIKKTKPGNNGNLIIPWFEGERTPDLPDGCPIYFGFNIENLNLETLSRGILEGLILNLHDGFIKLPVMPKTLHLTGGMSTSQIWCQTIANIFNCKTVSVKDEGAALGAAIHAAWVWENESGNEIRLKELSDPFIQFDEKSYFTPEKKYVETYHSLNQLYSSLSKRLRGLEADNPYMLRKNLT